jgi:hypothetical protein
MRARLSIPILAGTRGGDLLREDHVNVARAASGVRHLHQRVAAGGGRLVTVGTAYDSTGDTRRLTADHRPTTGLSQVRLAAS